MHPLLNSIRNTSRRHHLLPRGTGVMAAVSGGADSVSLLLALHALARELGLRLSAAHLNHSLRGRASDGDAAFVRRLACRLRIPLIEERADVRRLAAERHISTEMAAREARYAFFARAAQAAGAQVLATAHTADDQAETVLMKLARGTGMRGLGGIPRAMNRDGLRVVRPMLDATRVEVLAFLRARRAKWREDASNRDSDYLRNRIRHEILPLLERRLNPRIRSAILRMSEVLREEDEWLDHLCKPILLAARRRDGSLDVKRLLRQPRAARRRVLRLWLNASGVPADGIDFDAIQRIEEVIMSDRSTAAADVADAWQVRRGYGALHAGVARGPAVGVQRARVKIPGVSELRELGLWVDVRRKPGIKRPRDRRVGSFPAECSLSARAVGRRHVFVRCWRPGDRIKPLGMQGSRKLQDVFVDAKVPADDRARIPLFECGGEIVWVPGYRVARGWEVPDERAAALQIRIGRRPSA